MSTSEPRGIAAPVFVVARESLGRSASEHAIVLHLLLQASLDTHPPTNTGIFASFAARFAYFTMCIHTSIPLLAGEVEALDFFIPKSSRYQDTNSPVKHKQSWSTWRGLSSAHAEDLAICELEFRRVIQQKIAAYVDGFLNSSTKHDTIFTVRVNLFELAAEIADVYYEISQLPSPLLNLPSLVQFIRLHDCFVRSTSASSQGEPLKARIRVKMSHDSNIPVMLTYTPRLIFEDLVVQVQLGQNYYLRPRYTAVSSVSTHAGCAPKVTYTTTCGWLRYHDKDHYFAGTVPESHGAAQSIEVKATVVYHFPETAFTHEEIIQATVQILPIAPSPEFEHSRATFFVKHVRFADDTQICKAPETQKLRSRNSFSVLKNRSNMDQDWQCTGPSSMSSDSEDTHSFPVSDSDEASALSPRLKAGSCPELANSEAGSQRPTLISPEPEDSQPGIRSFYKAIRCDADLKKKKIHYSESDDDGISNQKCENIRKTFQVEFDPDEDPRDVREMKKELLQMELQGLSKSMLGYRIDRWSSEDISGELLDVQEMSEISELESSLKESMGF
jgi:hypothetical protein